jgi:hypothetical protein
MLASVTGVSVNVLAVVTSPTVAIVVSSPPAPVSPPAPAPSGSFFDALSVENQLIIAIAAGAGGFAVIAIVCGCLCFRRLSCLRIFMRLHLISEVELSGGKPLGSEQNVETGNMGSERQVHLLPLAAINTVPAMTPVFGVDGKPIINTIPATAINTIPATAIATTSVLGADGKPIYYMGMDD